MNNFWIILFHTFISKLKSKSFVVTTILTLLIVIGLTNMNNIITFFDKDGGKEKVAVLDETGQLFEAYKQKMNAINKDIKLSKIETTKDKAIEDVKNDKYKGLLVLSFDKNKLPAANYHTKSISDTALSGDLENGLQQLKTMIASSQMKLSPEQLSKLYEPPSFKKTALEENAKTEEELTQARGLVYVLLFVIYFAVIMYSNMIAMEVATEKTSRVMEILISSVSPIKQMFAKILGVALVSLTQLSMLLIVGYFSIKENLKSMKGGFFEFFGFEDIQPSTIFYAVVFFILGYFLYATLAAFLGSLVSRIEDIQQFITPMTMIVVAGFMIAMFGLNRPETPFITVTSYIPFFTPMLMFMRVGMLTLPVWEPMLGIVILLITIIVLAIFGARVYKGGVLMYGKSNSFKDIKKALQISKND
ncbi:ABC transporter permease [Bacillus methanolicus]|uniref:ABC transporter permease n=1 Tax=Bacillus methanolicus TaxID=1471 RepID=UPI00200F8942|nr:ABC transporter permease [Bacillus methanolicus]UQD51316.1 ABC transporter permease [Bacillus methanolicus]